MKKQYIVTFHTHYEALCCKRTLEQKLLETTVAEEMEGNKHLKEKESGLDEKTIHRPQLQIGVKLIPVPRELSSSCGTALSVEVKDVNTADIAFLFECEHDEVYTLDETGKYHLE